MMQTIDPERFEAFVQLLASPDPPDLPKRGHVLRYEGDPDRRTTRLPVIVMGWLQRRHLEHDADTQAPHAVRAVPTPVRADLRVLRPTGTDAVVGIDTEQGRWLASH